MMEARACRRPRILMLAWLCAPDRGSEWAAGWGMVVAAARIADVTVLADQDSADAMEAWCRLHPEAPIEVVAVTPEVGWRAWLSERLTKGFFMEYLTWLHAAGRVAQRLASERRFDLAVHGALGCYWLPSPVVDLGIPSIWGPVGGAAVPPLGLMPVLGLSGWIERVVKRIVLTVAVRLPATRRTMREASLVLVENEATLRRLPVAVAAHAGIVYRAALTQVPAVPPQPRGRYVLFPSTLSGRKGATLIVEAFHRVPADVTLKLANTGPDEERLRRLVARHGLEGRVEFLGRVPRETCFELVRGASAVVFAGINEDGGCALCEAMLLGAPVLVLAHGGPKEIVDRWCTDPARVALVPPAGSPAATAAAMGDALTHLLANLPDRNDPYFDQEGAMAEMVAYYGLALPERRHGRRLGALARANALALSSIMPAGPFL